MKQFFPRKPNFFRRNNDFRSDSRYAVNDQIRSDKLFVIDYDGTQLGEMDKIKALQLARERELDLIEVSPNAKPPVAKIYSFSKFKYQQEKKKKVNKSKSPEMKEMWFKVVIEKGDRDHKLKKIREFLDKKHPVKITIKGRGRVTRERYDKLMKTILADLADVATSEGFAKFDGRSMNTIVRANKVIKVKEASNEKQTKDTQSNGKTL